jgi:hypothetical protein
MQQDNCEWQPMTPSVLTTQIEQVELVQEEQINIKPSSGM